MWGKCHLQMDVAPWCYKWTNGHIGSQGGVRYRAPYSAYKSNLSFNLLDLIFLMKQEFECRRSIKSHIV